jgi:predicted AlkP superfamily phosphohydrolase/phosphomutase
MSGDVMSRKKVIVVGIDGADYSVLYEFMREGYLQNIMRLIEENGPIILESTIPVSSAPAWVSFLTGRPPEEHGVYGFILRTKSGRRIFANYNTIGTSTLYDIARLYDKKVLSINVPMTAPAPKTKGIVISGLSGYDLRISEKTVHPAPLARLLISRFGYEFIEPKDSIDVFEYIKESIALDKIRLEIFDDLMQSDNFDLAMIVFTASDRIQHFLWASIDQSHPQYKRIHKYKHILRDYYRLIDTYIGKLLKEHILSNDNATLIVLSDHGFRSVQRKVLVKNILFKRGIINIDMNIKKILVDYISYIFERYYFIIRPLLIKLSSIGYPLISLLKDTKTCNAGSQLSDIIDVLDQYDAWFINWELMERILKKNLNRHERKKIASAIVKLALKDDVLRLVERLYINDYREPLGSYLPDVTFQVTKPYMVSGALRIHGLPSIVDTARLTGSHDLYGIFLYEDSTGQKLWSNNIIKIRETTQIIYSLLGINQNDGRIKIINKIKKMNYERNMKG